MKAALPRCARCGASPNAIDLGAGSCFDRPRAVSCLWTRALRKWRMPRARQVMARIEAKEARELRRG
jgi:hypothetical protein